MMVEFGEIFKLPSFSIKGLLSNPIWMLAILLALLAVALLIYNHFKKKGKVYSATIFERVGEAVRKRKTKVYAKVKNGKLRYRIGKLVVPITLDDAILSKKGNAEFFLFKIDNRYLPIKPATEVELEKLKGTKKEIKKIELKHFHMAVGVNLDEMQAAAIESAEDAKDFSHWDKWSQLLLTLGPYMALMISYVLLYIGIKQLTGIGATLQPFIDSIAGYTSQMGRVAEALEMLAAGGGGIPPG